MKTAVWIEKNLPKAECSEWGFSTASLIWRRDIASFAAAEKRNKMKRFFALLISVSLALSGCASYRPMVDTKNANMDNYESDLRECQAYAENESPAGSAAVGAIAGAAVGALLAVVAGSDYDRGASAGVGAVVGGLSGGASSGEAQIDIIKNCMSGRGYRVLR